ncbi:importin-11-like [Tubulanus polymorphus]|uniref:importin-11-like n=1 Tax=Tubulanus polymorphus TaxID=672921 RepID=UPI003DA2191C
MNAETAGPVVLDTLQRACSQSTEVLKPAEAQLKEWETKPGFYSILASIFSNHSIDVNVRWLAVLYFKNGVDRYWRKNAPNAISEAEKILLRQQLITNFNEPVNQIATQLSVLIGKIARVDCPRNWTELIPVLLDAVQIDDALLQQRALLTFYHVIKTLASKRLVTDRKLFEELAGNTFGFVMKLWDNQLTHYFHMMQSGGTSCDVQAMTRYMDRSLLALKVLRKLYVFGFREPGHFEDPMNFIRLLLERCRVILEAKNQMSQINEMLVEQREKCLVTLTKLLLDAQEYHPLSFIHYLQPTLDLIVQYNFTNRGKDLLSERLHVNFFVLMKNIIRCDKYRTSKPIEEVQNPARIQVIKIKQEFFTPDVLKEICHILVNQYFLYTMDDLAEWDSNPEDFVSAETGDSWKYSLRPCTEVFYLTLFKEYREILTPVVMSMVHEINDVANSEDLTILLRKDAVYNAVGLASYDLFDEINFDEWFTSKLIPELHQAGPMNRLIRRRVIWLIGEWINVKLAPNLRPLLYENILELLKDGEDRVVHIQAANTLRLAIDDFEFSIDSFLPYLESSFSLLFNLLKEVVECETKMQILHVMSFIIQRADKEIKPHAEHLLRYLPMLWDAAAEHNMLRCAILSTLVNLVQGLGTLCVNAYNFLFPGIQLSTDVTQEPHIYLMEDGLELWRTTLHNSPIITPGLLALYKNMPALLDLGTEHLHTCLKIIESYLFLAPKEFLQDYSTSLVTSISSLISDMRVEGIAMVMKVVELVLRIFPVEGAQIFKSMLPGIVKNILQGESYPVLMAAYLSIVSRIILQNSEFFWLFIDEFSREIQADTHQVLGSLLDMVYERIDNITQPERRKLVGLACASLLPCNNSVVVEKFGANVNLCVEILHDVCRLSDEDSSSHIDCLVFSEEDLQEDESDTEHDKRKRQVNLHDPVHSISMKDFVNSQLAQCQQVFGAQNFQHQMSLVDSEITHQLKFLLR